MKRQRFIISFIAVIITLAIGSSVIIGWFIHNDALRSVVPGAVKMKFNMALGLILSSIVILLNYPPPKKRIIVFVSGLLSLVVLLTGLLTVAEFIFNCNIGIDEFFIKDELPATAVYYAGRMSPLSAINLVLFGIGLLLLPQEKAPVYQFFYLSFVTFISLLILIGFNILTDIPTFMQVAIHTAIGFVSLSSAIWFSQPALQKKISFERKLFTGFAAVIILIIIIGILSFYYNDKRAGTAKLVSHTNDVLNEAEQTLSITKDLESGSRGYVITGDSIYLQHFTVAKDTLFSHISNLAWLTKDSQVQQKRIRSLKDLVARRIGFSIQSIAVRNEQGVSAAGELVASRQGKFLMDTIRNLIDDIQGEERSLLAQRQQENEKSIVAFNHAFLIFISGVFILVVIILFAIRINIAITKKAEAQKKAAEEKIKGNERIFTDLFYKSPVMKAIADAATGKYIEVNDAFADFTEHEKKDMIGKSSVELNLLDDTGDRNMVLKQLQQNGFARNIETQIRTGNGNTKWVSTNIDKIDLYGKHCFLTAAIDITDRKIAEDKLVKFSQGLEQTIKERTEEIKRSEKKYRYLFENSPMPMCVIDASSFKFLDVNEIAVLQYGYSREEFLSMTALDIQTGDRKEFLNRPGNSNSDHTENYDKGVWAHRKKDGTVIQVEIIAHQIIFEGIPARLILANDVTGKKKTEEKLIASEKQFRSTLDNMLEGAQIIGFDWKYIYVNDALAKHAKYKKEELIGYTVMEKYPGIEEAEIFKIYQRCFYERISIHLENEFRFPDNSIGWFELSFQPVPEGIFILSIDITERKRIEEQLIKSEKIYKTIASSIPDSVICLLDRDFRYLLIEGDMLERVGYSKDILLGNKAEDVLPDAVFADIQKEFQRVLQGETISRESVRRGVDTFSKLIPLKDENDFVYSIMTVAIDVTKLKNAQRDIAELNHALEEKVAERTAQLETVNKELEAFSYSVSHDLRAPLRGIVGFTEMLEEKYISKLDAEAGRLTNIIKANTLKMGVLIDDLLTFSRMSRQEIVKNDIPTNDLVVEIVAELDTPRTVEWAIHPLPDSFGDIKTIRQVWINLISNAKKYSRKSAEPKVEIGVITDAAQTVFFVKDNGVGFDAKYLNKLFKVFQRLHSTDEFEGTGVGLAIVEKIISKHGGKVWAEAEKNVGATFYFSLPAK